MRTGLNPMRRKALKKPSQHVAAVITHLPYLTGYHEHRLEVVLTSLLSLRKNAGKGVHVLIWDNGSCEELRSWLQDVFEPDTLILSSNVGKSSARASVFHMFPAGTVISMADDDMLYYPNWYAAQLKLLEGFPDVGAVSGYPVRTQFRWGTESTIAWAQSEPRAELKTGRFIPDEWERDVCSSIGRDPNWHQQYTAHEEDSLIAYEGLEAYATAHHCQFMGYAERLAPLTEWNSQATSDEKEFDKAIDRAGYLRLTTKRRTCRHIGNVMDQFVAADAQEMGLTIKEAAIWA